MIKINFQKRNQVCTGLCGLAIAEYYRLHRYSAINEGTKAGEGFANIKPTKVDGLFSKCARSACVYTETNKAERTWMDINGYWLEVFHKELFIDA